MTLHITSTKSGEAVWWIEHNRIWMESLAVLRNPGPAYRIEIDGSIADIGRGARGVVYFWQGEDRPQLPWVEERFPDHKDLWVAVEAAFFDVTQPLEESRLNSLRPVVDALDYTTGQWTVEEIRDAACTLKRSA
ncbi:hypothetical protein NONI108955_10870 [Nocardia ninae]|uniref:Uncharacterized protein n=1 Tax=Nocardia ninae NBRC 108245 TaxID=1210091 RepID=A0A511MN01_9NOCA|nr:hypothetical protein [Nocardia ninae]GEM42000.1 hypothetical protein NN4_65190 [Nocardia ninae NBRC 108245]